MREEVKQSIVFASGAEANILAEWVRQTVAANLSHNKASRRPFEALRAAVALVAPDRRASVTLRFDLGCLTLHDGMVGVADITFCADYSTLVALSDLPLSRWGNLPLIPLCAQRRQLWKATMSELLSGELKIYGLFSRPDLVWRVVRLLSSDKGRVPS